MAANIDPIFPLTPKTAAATIVYADSTNKKTLLTAGANGARLDQIRICSDDTAAVIVQVFSSINGGTTWHILGEVVVPIGAGTNGTEQWVDVLETLNSEDALALQAVELIGVAAKAAVTSGKTVTVTARYGDF